ncbi:cysteine-rich CWC family protein [Pseudomonas sp. B392_1p]|uniref:cysteine-rich CWC family protein n=1 Tax=Pseudomonas sp. B392_1p TaxID=3457507 RepID=UPI003FD015EF
MTSDSQCCPLCGQTNLCEAQRAIETGQPCWCFSSVIESAAVLRVPAQQRNQACLCHACATTAVTCPGER